MIFRPYYHFETGCAGYVFGCGTLGTCAVVDIRQEDIYSAVAFAASKNMRITHVIDTHVHADHRSGGMELARRIGAAHCLHESASVAESICLLVTDLRRGTDPWFVLTGDTLFIGAVGRPDLRGRARESAADLFESLHQRLLTLPDDVEIYPGHFSGSMCGTGLSGKPSSTIAFEKRWNPMLRLDRDTFIARLADVPPEPADRQKILAFNRGQAVETVR